MNLHTVGELVSVGVRRVAVVRAVGDATDPEAAAAAIKAALPPLS